MKIDGMTLIKGLFYFMLKGKEGGKYRSRKKVVDPKTGKMRWGNYVYEAPKKNVKQPKPKADNNNMKHKDDIILLPDDYQETPTQLGHPQSDDSDIIQIKNEPKKRVPKTDIEKYRDSLWSKSPKYIINKIVGSSKEEGMKILQSLQNRTQKIKEVAKAIPENARVSESDFVEAINSGKVNKLSQVLENIQSHKDIIWTD